MNLLFEEKKPGKKCEVWSIGGGKGGTGKSFIVSNIGVSLAEKGNRVILIDADFGGANLHSFLGIKKPKTSLADFFDRKIPVGELVVETSIPNLGFVAGSLHSLDYGSIKHAQKLKLFRQIKSLNADYAVIDIGAGSHVNTVDTFLLAEKMIVAILPEVTSIDNMNHFIKNVLFRKLNSSFAASGMKHILQETWKNKGEYGIESLKGLMDYLRDISIESSEIIDKTLSDFRLHIILNQVRNNQDISIGNSVKSLCRKSYGFRSSYVGYVEYDDVICGHLNRREPYLRSYATSRSARELKKTVENLLHSRQWKGVGAV